MSSTPISISRKQPSTAGALALDAFAHLIVADHGFSGST